MPIDFKNGSTDTGLDETSSISPVADGEQAVAAVFNRPSENLRQRTEVLRTFADTEEMIRKVSSELECFITDGGSVVFDGPFDGVGAPPAIGSPGSGALQLKPGAPSTTELFIRPVGAASTPNYASKKFDDPGLTYSYTVTSNVYAWQGGNRIEWKVLNNGRTTGSPVIVTVSGGTTILDTNGVPTYGNHIEIDYISTATLTDLQTAIAGDPVASVLVSITFNAGDATKLLFDVDPPQTLAGGSDPVLYRINNSTLDSFFATQTNRLQPGDVLAIDIESDNLKLARLDTGAANVLVGDLVTSRANPDRFTKALPIFAVHSETGTTHGVLVGGTRCEQQKETVPGSGDWRAYLASTATGEGASLVSIEDVGGNYVASDVEGALSESAQNLTQYKTDLASNLTGKGASLVGIEDNGNFYQGSTVEDALQEVGLDTYEAASSTVNKATLYNSVLSGFTESFNFTTNVLSFTSGSVLIDGKRIDVPSFTVGVFGSTETVVLSNAVSSVWAVVYVDSGGNVAVVDDNTVVLPLDTDVPICFVQHDATTITRVVDVRRFLGIPSGRGTIYLGYSPGTPSVTDGGHFTSFGGALYWTACQPSLSSVTIRFSSSSTKLMTAQSVSTSTYIYDNEAFNLGSVAGQSINVSLLGDKTKNTTLYVDNVTSITSALTLLDSIVKNITISSSATITSHVLDISNSVVDNVEVSHTTTGANNLVIIGSNAVIDDLRLGTNTTVDVSSSVVLVSSAQNSVVRNLESRPLTIVNSAAYFIAFSGACTGNSINGLVTGYANTIDYSGLTSGSDNTVDIESSSVGDIKVPAVSIARTTTYRYKANPVSKFKYIGGSEFKAGANSSILYQGLIVNLVTGQQNVIYITSNNASIAYVYTSISLNNVNKIINMKLFATNADTVDKVVKVAVTAYTVEAPNTFSPYIMVPTSITGDSVLATITANSFATTNPLNIPAFDIVATNTTNYFPVLLNTGNPLMGVDAKLDIELHIPDNLVSVYGLGIEYY